MFRPVLEQSNAVPYLVSRSRIRTCGPCPNGVATPRDSPRSLYPRAWLLVAAALLACSTTPSSSARAHEVPLPSEQRATASARKTAVAEGRRDHCQPVPATRPLPSGFPTGWYAAEPIESEVYPRHDAGEIRRLLRFAVRFDRHQALRVREDIETVRASLPSEEFTRARDRWTALDWTEVHCWPATGQSRQELERGSIVLPAWHPVRLQVQVVPAESHGFIYSQLAAPPLPQCISNPRRLCQHWRLEPITARARVQRLDALVARALAPENCQAVAACCATKSTNDLFHEDCRSARRSSDPLSCYAKLQNLWELLQATEGPCSPPEGWSPGGAGTAPRDESGSE